MRQNIRKLQGNYGNPYASRRMVFPCAGGCRPASNTVNTHLLPSPEPMPIAFKEWAVTVRALAEGEQLITLRKGGIREPDKHFALEHERFFLYPTFDHQREDLVRE
jgi:hypothetical protein